MSEAPAGASGWVEALAARLRARGLPPRQLLAVDGQLDVVVDAGVRLTVEFRPLKPDARCYKRTARFAVSYRGARDLSPEQRRAVDVIIAEVAQAEATLPARFSGVTAVGDLEESPHLAFARRFPFAQIERAGGRSAAETEVLVRLTPVCNQSCAFCSAPPTDKPSPDAVRDCLRFVGEKLPGARVTLTGGEPTLRSTFAEEVRFALEHSRASQVTVQTNAVSFASGSRAAELPQDPRLAFFVSLHAVEEEIYDRVTETKGQLPLALRGIRALLARGYAMTLNAVATAHNVAHLEQLVRSLPEVLAPHRVPVLHFSILMCPPFRPGAAELLVRYAEAVPALERAAAAGAQLGIEVESLVSSTHASVPRCLARGPGGSDGRRPELAPGETGYEDLSRSWVKANRCRECSADKWCLGVPAPYAARFGLAELQPLPH